MKKKRSEGKAEWAGGAPADWVLIACTGGRGGAGEAHIVLAEGRRVADGRLKHDVLGLDVPVDDVVFVEIRHG